MRLGIGTVRPVDFCQIPSGDIWFMLWCCVVVISRAYQLFMLLMCPHGLISMWKDIACSFLCFENLVKLIPD